ncbi:hypothetical protein Ciccas_003011 [Cichlidogyrus casuarinus]|uniref:Uncharacterized protein n=1 Tax=Cichlidogyrus casuarinus TaxID=1844966 RepID=A0ABD2QFL2_9PLAT
MTSIHIERFQQVAVPTRSALSRFKSNSFRLASRIFNTKPLNAQLAELKQAPRRGTTEPPQNRIFTSQAKVVLQGAPPERNNSTSSNDPSTSSIRTRRQQFGIMQKFHRSVDSGFVYEDHVRAGQQPSRRFRSTDLDQLVSEPNPVIETDSDTLIFPQRRFGRPEKLSPKSNFRSEQNMRVMANNSRYFFGSDLDDSYCLHQSNSQSKTMPLLSKATRDKLQASPPVNSKNSCGVSHRQRRPFDYCGITEITIDIN